MGKEFPYEACKECPYKLAGEDREVYGPRSFAVATEELACGQKTCKLEGAVMLSSSKLNKLSKENENRFS